MPPTPPPHPRALARRAAAEARGALTLLPGPRPAWVEVRLGGAYPFHPPPPPRLSVAALGARPTPLERLERDLERLAAAPWVEGVVLRLGDPPGDLATLYALRAAVARLSAAGPRTVAWTERFDLRRLYLASAAERIALPAAAEIAPLGLGLEARYLGAALRRVGVAAEKVATGPHKSAGDRLIAGAMSDAEREQLGRWLAAVEDVVTAAIARGRGVEPERVAEWFERPPASAAEALERGLVDDLASDPAPPADAHAPRAGPRATPLAAARRRLPVRRPPLAGRFVAVVAVHGTIATGPSRRLPLELPLLGRELAGSDTLVPLLRDLARDDRCGAVVLAVDSPGGSALASDRIGVAVEALAGAKPVVAHMGGVAASGGYYVLTHAHRVLAAPTTVTGSIGVVVIKAVLEELYRRLGVAVERVALHPHALQASSARAWDERQRAWVERAVDAIDARFRARVAAGRDLAPGAVDALAGGRVWSGRDALERGLVDELAPPRRALELACELADLPAGAPVAAAPRGRRGAAGGVATLASELAALERGGPLLLAPFVPRLAP